MAGYIPQTMDIANEKQFLRPSAQVPDERSKQRLIGNRNNCVAYELQKSLHGLLAQPRLAEQLSPDVKQEIAYQRGLAFEGLYPDAGDFHRAHHSIAECGHDARMALMDVFVGAEELIEREELKWRDELPELARMYQDTRIAMHDLPHDHGGRIVSFGSARTKTGAPEYKAAMWLNQTIVQSSLRDDGTTEQGITGAGPGIMKAANDGLMRGRLAVLKYLYEQSETAGPLEGDVIAQQIVNARMQMHSVGVKINLPFEATWNEHLQMCLSMKHFGPRKEALVATMTGRSVEHAGDVNLHSSRSPAVFLFPGGFGSWDELFEVLTLVQCGKMPPVPIYVIGVDTSDVMKEVLEHMNNAGTISPRDNDLLICCDNEREAVEHYLAQHQIEPLDWAQAEINSYEPQLGK